MKKPQLLVAGLFLLPAAAWQPATAQSLDPTFSPSAVYAPGGVYSAVEQPDGKRVVAGAFSRINGTAAPMLARFETTGSLDAGFQQNLGAASRAYRPRVLANGKILVISVGGTITAGGITRQSVLRLNANGTGDATFDPGTGATSSGSPTYVDDMLPLANGQTVVVGPFDRFNGTVANNIVRLTATGAVDPAFTSGLGSSSEIETIVGLANGQLLIGGNFSSYDGHPCHGLARLNANGTYDATFATTLDSNSDVLNLVVQPDGKILVAGGLNFAKRNNGQGLIRLLPTGADDTSFASPSLEGYDVGSFLGDAVQVQPNGKILIAGYGITGASSQEVARLNADGTLDTSFQSATSSGGAPNSLTLLASGKVLVAGSFTAFNGVADRPLVQLTNTGGIDATFQPVIQIDGSVTAVVQQADGKLVVGGNFTEINGQAVRYLARFNSNGTRDAAFSPTGPTAPVADLALQPDGRLLAVAGGTVRRLLNTGAPDNSFSAANTGNVPSRLLLLPDGRIVVGSYSGLTRLLANGSADGTFSTSGLGTNAIRYVQALALQSDGKLLVANYFTMAGGSGPVSTVVRLQSSGEADATFTSSPFKGAFVNSGLNSLAVQPDGKILVGGRFTAYGTTPLSDLARLNPDGTADAGFTSPAISGSINKVLLQPNNRILLGGLFSGPGLPTNLARLLPTGAADATFGPTAVPNNSVRALLIQPDGKLVLGGTFATIGGQPSAAVARITAGNVLHVRAPQAVAARTEAWPVPAHTSFQVAPDASAHPLSVDLLDVLGQPVLHQLLNGGAPVSLRVENLQAGTYLLQVTYSEGLVMRRIQVE